MKTLSKVKSVQASGTWNSQDGTLYYKFDYTFEDGVSMNASHKTNKSFEAGDEVEYEIKRTHETYGNSGTVSKPNTFQKGGKNSQGSTASFALSYAKDWCLGLHNAGNTQTPDNVIAVADKFNEWLKQN